MGAWALRSARRRMPESMEVEFSTSKAEATRLLKAA